MSSLQSVSCQNCGAAVLDWLYSAPFFDHPEQTTQVGRCHTCGLVNTSALAADELAAAYTAEYYGSVEQKFATLLEIFIQFLRQRQASSLLHLWSKVTERGTGRSSVPSGAPEVLDIGCGRGLLLQAFEKKGASIHGLERAEYDVPPSLREVVKVGAISDQAFVGKHFDLIILWHVLEHLPNTEEMLQHLRKHLQENGLLVLSVPNFGSIQQRLFGKHWFHLDVPRHLLHLESQWLIARLQAQGLIIERVGYFDLTQNIFGFIQSAFNRLVPHRANEFYRLLKRGQRRHSGLLALWSLGAAILLPLALLESLYSVLAGRGATVTVVARLPAMEKS